jgi:hypothetical protein
MDRFARYFELTAFLLEPVDRSRLASPDFVFDARSQEPARGRRVGAAVERTPRQLPSSEFDGKTFRIAPMRSRSSPATTTMFPGLLIEIVSTCVVGD